MSDNKSIGNVDLFTNKLNIKWTIDNAKSVFNSKKHGEYILSTPITDGELKWYIILYPSGFKENKNFMEIYLGIYQENEVNETNYELKFEFSILNENGSKIQKDKMFGVFKLTESNDENDKVEFSNGKYCQIGSTTFLPISNLKNYLTPSKSFIINCKIEKIFDSFKINQLNENSLNKKKIFETTNFKAVSEDEKFCDLELIVKNTSYFLHKVVLASKSSVFMNILESNESNKKQVIKINNLKDDAVLEMLRYIYDNLDDKEIENINEAGTVDLLIAADKYDIGELKRMCEDELIKKITVENAIDFLILAETHNAGNLKLRAINLIAENMNLLNNSENWLKLNSDLVANIVSLLIKPN